MCCLFCLFSILFKQLCTREEKKEEVKKTYDWKKGVKKVEKKPVEEAKAPEKVQLKKAKPVEKQKEETKEGVKLKPIPGKEKTQPEKAEPVKLKPVPAKEKKEEVKLDYIFSICLLFRIFLQLSIFAYTQKLFIYMTQKYLNSSCPTFALVLVTL